MKTISINSKGLKSIFALFVSCLILTNMSAQCDTFSGPDLDGDGVVDTQDYDADNDGILNVDEFHCESSPFEANWGSLTDPMAATVITWPNVDGSGVDIELASDYYSGAGNINTPSTQGGFLSLGLNATDVNDPNQYVKFTFTFSEPIIVSSFRIQDIDNENRFTTSSYNDQVLVEVFDNNFNPLPLATNLGANLVQASDGFISDPTGTTPVSFGNTAHWATFTTPILVRSLCVTYDPGDGGGIDDSGDQFISLANLMFCLPYDTDGDMVPDYLDLDSDNDGIPDLVEACGNSDIQAEDCRLDSDGSAMYPDYDGDGCPDGIVSTYCTDGPIDSDMDNIPDFIDLDSDNDGCNDNEEGGVAELGTSGDEYVAGSVDGDGLLTTGISGVCPIPSNTDYIDASTSAACVPPCTYVGDDKDNDGIIDEIDTDTDNDGIPNENEYGCDAESFLINWNVQDDPAGSMDFDWVDISGSGLGLNLQSSYPPTVDNIGSPSTSSGFLLFGMNASDVNQSNQFSEYVFTFTEPISVMSFRVQDIDNESRFTTTSYNDQVLFEFLDGNGNALPQTVQLGSSLVQLANGFVTDPSSTEPVSFGTMDNWATYSTTGLVSSIRIVYDPGNGGFTDDSGDQFIALGDIDFCIPRDTDLDGIPDYKDLDSDNDGIPDAVEACGNNQLTLENCSLDDDASAVYPDFNEDGCPDGLVDSYCTDAPIDTDGDGTPDYIDLDSDGDGCADSIEAGTEELGTNEDTYVATTNVDDCGLLLSGISGVCPIPTDLIYIDENTNNCAAPAIRVVKSVTGVTLAQSGVIGNRDVTYQFIIKNTGNLTLANVSLNDDIQSWIGGAFVRVVVSPSASVGGGNSAYNGTSSNSQLLDLTASLDPQETMSVSVVVEIDPNNATAILQPNGEILNQALATGNAVNDDGTPSDAPNPTDLSDSGTDPDTDNPDAPGNHSTSDDPTPFRMPIISVNKVLVSNVVPANNPNINEIKMRVKLTNIGNMPLTNLSLVDALDAPNNFGQFYAGLIAAPFISSSNISTPPGLNSGYDGLQAGQDNLFDGMSGLLLSSEFVEVEIGFQIDLSVGDFSAGFTNQANGSADYIDPDTGETTTVTDLSDDGTEAETTNPGSPGDMGTTDDPSPVMIIAGGSIGDFVFLDQDGDGIQDFGEDGIPNVTVVLYDSNDNVIAITTSDANGNYLFEDIPSGQYYLGFDVPSVNGEEFVPTSAFSGNSTDLDSDVTGANGPNTTQVFTLSGNQEINSVDAGFYQCVPFGDYVWYDSNMNSIQDPEENGLNGIKIRVYRLESSGYELFDETKTGHKPDTPSDDGYWKFCLPPGTYYVEVVENIQHLVLVQPNRGSNDNLDSDVTGQFGPNTTGSYFLQSGNDECSVGAGFHNESTIGNQVWLDLDENGIQDSGEPGLEGILLSLYTKSGEFVASQITNYNGLYQFGGLRENEYFVEVAVPDSLGVTLTNVGSDVIDNDLDNSNGLYTTGCISVAPGGSNISIDIGLVDQNVENTILSNEWLGFTASHATNHHLIEWSFAKLELAEKAIVERRLESEFEFKAISTVGRDEFSAWMKYQDYDIASNGNYYYRVVMLNFDGSYSYTHVKVLNRTDEEKDGINNFLLTPNPVHTQLTLQITGEGVSYDQIELVDVNGKAQYIGDNVLINLNTQKTVKINVDQLTPGVYFIVTTQDGELQTQKFVKL